VSHLVKVAHDATQAGADTTSSVLVNGICWHRCQQRGMLLRFRPSEPRTVCRYHTTAAYHDIWLLVHLKGHLKRSSRYSPSSNVG
jgi:hypothetical protein